MIPTETRREMIDDKSGALSVVHQCRLLSLARSTLYYTASKAYNECDLQMMEALDRLHLEDPTRGTRRMRKELIKLDFQIGRRYVRTLMRHMRIRTIFCKPRTTISDPTKYKYPYLLRNVPITRPNQAWAIDITYIPMPKGHMYLTAIIDLHSRYIVGWSISNTMEAEWVTQVVKDAVEAHGKPEIMNSDQGVQFTSDSYLNYLKSQETIQISMDGKGRAIDNVFIERFWRTIKYDKLYLCKPENGRELHQACAEFIAYYNHRRDHSSIGDQPPVKAYLNEYQIAA
jgi:putative transposase